MFTMILKHVGKMLGLYVVPDLVPPSMSKLQTNHAFPFGFPGLLYTKLIEIIRRLYRRVFQGA